MKRNFSSAVCMAALLLVAGAATDASFAPAMAQNYQVDFDTFHDRLSDYGDWVYSDRWGEVWIPTDVSDDFHPYGTRGHWAYTDEYGWTWVSGYEWGDIPFHYGRWVNDPDDGWMWIPGYVWSPGWVVWRQNGQYTGWMPAPPDEEFLGGGASAGISFGNFSINFNSGNDYGYSRWYGRGYGEDRYAQNWVFVGTAYVGAQDYRRYQAPRNNYTTIIRNTKNITNYTVVNNYIVNRSVTPRSIQRAGGRFQTVRVADVVRQPQFVTRVDTGRQVQARMRMQMRRGNGMANSAPTPNDAVVQTLSTKAPPMRGGRSPAHLYTRDTVRTAPLQPSATGNAPGANLPPTPENRGAGDNRFGSPMDQERGGKHGRGPRADDTRDVNGAPPAAAATVPNGGPPDETERGTHRHGPNAMDRVAPAAPAATVAPNAPTPPSDEAPRGRHRHGPNAMDNAAPAAPAAAAAPNAAPPPSDEAPRGRHRHGPNVMGNGAPATPATTAAPNTAPPPTDEAPHGRHRHGPEGTDNATPSPSVAPAPNAAPPVSPAAATPPANPEKPRKPKKPDDDQNAPH